MEAVQLIEVIRSGLQQVQQKGATTIEIAALERYLDKLTVWVEQFEQSNTERPQLQVALAQYHAETQHYLETYRASA